MSEGKPKKPHLGDMFSDVAEEEETSTESPGEPGAVPEVAINNNSDSDVTIDTTSIINSRKNSQKQKKKDPIKVQRNWWIYTDMAKALTRAGAGDKGFQTDYVNAVLYNALIKDGLMTEEEAAAVRSKMQYKKG